MFGEMFIGVPLWNNFWVGYERAHASGYEKPKNECSIQGRISFGHAATTWWAGQGPCELMSAWESQRREPEWAKLSQSEPECVRVSHRESQSEPESARVS